MVMAIVLERRELPSRCLCLLGLRLLAPFPMDEPQIAEIDEQAGALSEDEHRVLAPQRVHEQDGAAGQREIPEGDRDDALAADLALQPLHRSEEQTSELQSLMRISYAVFCLKKKKTNT